MISSLSWTDADGVATLTNDKPGVATRFADWVVHRKPVGPPSVALGTGRTAVFEFREATTASFSIVGIPESEMELMIRLQYHLLNGYIIALAGDRAMADDFALCTLAPETEPEISQSDSQLREYTMSFVVQAIDAEDVITEGEDAEEFYPPGEEDCEFVSGLSGVQDYGDDFEPWGEGDYELFRADTEANDNYPTNPHTIEFGSYSDAEGFVEWPLDFDDGTPAISHTDFETINIDGDCHRMLKFTRLPADIADEDDDPTATWGGGVYMDRFHDDSPLTEYTDFFQRLVVNFNEGFEFDADLFEDIRLMAAYGDTEFPFFNSVEVYVESTALGDGLKLVWYMDKSGVFTGTDGEETDLVPLAEFFDGTPKELIMRCRDMSGANAKIELWYGPAFGALEKIVDIEPAYPATHPGLRGGGWHAWTDTLGALYRNVDVEKWYGIIEWELGPGADFTSASWFGRLETPDA